jgi:DNA-binding NtrC family response regulator
MVLQPRQNEALPGLNRGRAPKRIQWEEFTGMAGSATERKFQVLVIDDEQHVREFVSDVLRREGWNVSQSPSAADAFDRLHEAEWSVVFCDLTLARSDGYSVLRTFKDKLPETNVVLMTGHSNATGALDAAAFGAYDYFLKPFGAEELRSLSQALLEQSSHYSQKTSPARRTAAYPSDIQLVGRSQALIEVLKHVARVSNTNLPVLLSGEPGTGKELVASAIHYRSGRADRPFAVIRCVANQIEVDLAHGGTVFLDEITAMNSTFQAKLFGALQRGEIRVIGATSRNVEQEVTAGKFREDLFNVLNAVSIALPPLRDRTEDIPPLAQSFADRVYSLRTRVRFAAEALALLERYYWPGNIRELEKAVVRAVAMCDGTIRVKDLPHRVRQYSGKGSEMLKTNGGAEYADNEEWVPLSEIEGRYVVKVLAHTHGNKQAAARVLGVDRKTLDRMIKRHHIETNSLRARAKPPAPPLSDNSSMRS